MKLPRLWPELLWGVFAAANAATMTYVGDWQTIPFHLIWISLTLLYGFRVWSLGPTIAVVAVVVVTTGVPLALHSSHGHEGWGEVSEVPLMAAVFVAMVWHARRRQAALEATGRLAQREREFVRDASHGLRTPITVARGHAELIRSENPGGQAALDAEVVIEELDRLARISNQLLLLAAVEHPEFLCREPVEVERVIAMTARRWGAVASRRWLVSAADDGVILVDPERLDCVLDALIENAVKFTTEDDRIAIVGRTEGETVVIEISDTGPGIAAEDRARIFGRFSRADGPRPRGSGGTGLGLAIVKAIVEAHGGSVGVESEPGHGSTFEIRLPCFRPNGHPTPPRALVRQPTALTESAG